MMSRSYCNKESFEPGKGCFGLNQCQARLYTAILRHAVLRPPPTGPDAPPPAEPGLIPLTAREVRRLLTAALDRPKPPGHAARRLQ